MSSGLARKHGGMNSFGGTPVIHSLLIAAQPTPAAESVSGWPGTALVITGISLIIALIASRTIERPKTGPKMPLPFPSLFNNMSAGAFLGSVSLGHIVGVLTILALKSTGNW